MDLKNMVEGEKLVSNLSKYKKIFFYRICGTGMGSAACLLKEAGYDVHGADVTYSPPMSTYLESTKIPLYNIKEVTKEFLQKFDLIIVGNSIPRVSDYSAMIESSGVDFTSFPSVLGALVLKKKNVIGIAGTHGKTTTTYFMTQLLEKLGKDPGYLIGGILDDIPPSKIGGTDYFVIESDEYDSAYFQKYSKFRLYELKNMILTSLEFDHADIFKNVEEIEEQFKAIMPNIAKTTIINNGYASCLKLFNQYKKNNWFLYGKDSEIGPSNIVTLKEGSSFDLNYKGQKISFKTNVVGEHNIYNLSSCLIYLLNENFTTDKLQKAVLDMKMVKRRQEFRGYYKKAIVIDDFAHHPRAIDLTVNAIKVAYPNKKILTVFEPISATARSSVFQKEFRESLESSNKVILAQNPLRTTVANSNNLNCDQIVDELNNKKIQAFCAKD